jgi:hypothetical protein
MGKKLFRIASPKLVFLIITFLVIFFVNFPALSNPCSWSHVCPDFIRHSIISYYPNFYSPAGCGYGIAYICWQEKMSYSMLVIDILVWLFVNALFFVLSPRIDVKKKIKK